VDTGAGLLGIALICYFLIGPVGPCGPSTPWGFLAMLIAFVSFIAAWVVSIVALIARLVSSKTRAKLLVPVVISTTFTASLGFLMKRSIDVRTWGDAAWVLLYVWPPTVAVVHAVQERLLPGDSELTCA
jgi:hypothetical protein